MACVLTSRAFNMDELAERFPGALVFRGAPSGQVGLTEIEGDVELADLLRELEALGVDAVEQVVPHVDAAVEQVAVKVKRRIHWATVAVASVIATAIHEVIHLL